MEALLTHVVASHDLKGRGRGGRVGRVLLCQQDLPWGAPA